MRLEDRTQGRRALRLPHTARHKVAGMRPDRMPGEKKAPVIGRWALVRLCFGLLTPVTDCAATG